MSDNRHSAQNEKAATTAKCDGFSEMLLLLGMRTLPARVVYSRRVIHLFNGGAHHNLNADALRLPLLCMIITRHYCVIKVLSLPYLVPTLLVATIRK